MDDKKSSSGAANKLERLFGTDKPYESRPVLKSPLFLVAFVIMLGVAIFIVTNSR